MNFVARVVVYCSCARTCTCTYESGCLKMAGSQSSSARVDSVDKLMSVEVSIFLQSHGIPLHLCEAKVNHSCIFLNYILVLGIVSMFACVQMCSFTCVCGPVLCVWM